MLLIDELDRADEEFEAYLLELLSDFQVTIPEVETVKATAPPVVIITSNRTREIHDALKRRCIYHWIDYPDFEREVAILQQKAPDLPDRLAAQLAASHGTAARPRSVQASRRRRDARLGGCADGARAAGAHRRRHATTRSASCSSTRRTSSGCGSLASMARCRLRAERERRLRRQPGALRAVPARSRAPVAPQHGEDLAAAIEAVGLDDRTDLYLALRACVVT